VATAAKMVFFINLSYIVRTIAVGNSLRR